MKTTTQAAVHRVVEVLLAGLVCSYLLYWWWTPPRISPGVIAAHPDIYRLEFEPVYSETLEVLLETGTLWIAGRDLQVAVSATLRPVQVARRKGRTLVKP